MRMGAAPDKSYIEVLGWGKVTPNGDIQWLDGSLKLAPIDVKAGTAGEISIDLTVFYYYLRAGDGMFDLPVPLPRKGLVQCGCTWNYTCSEDGEFFLQGYLPRPGPPGEFTVQLTDLQSNPPLNAKRVAGRPFVKFVPVFYYAGSSGSTSPVSFSLGAGISVTPPGNAGTAAASSSQGIVADLNIIGQKVKPPTPPLDASLLTRNFHFEHENQKTLDGNTKPENKLTALVEWVRTVQKTQPYLYKAIEEAHVMINVTGYASPPGTYEYNSDVSDARASYVKEHLGRRIGDKSVSINKRAYSEDHSKSIPGIKPNQRDSAYLKDRRVEVVIKEHEAKRGIALVVDSGWLPP